MKGIMEVRRYSTTIISLNSIKTFVNWYNLHVNHPHRKRFSGLTGLNKAETAAKHGEKQVQIWRRSFDIPPPAMDLIHPYYNIIVNDANNTS